MPYKDITKQRASQLSYIKNRRAEWLLQNGPCKCGSWNDLEVDHVDPNQKVSHRIWSWSQVRMMEELSKCQVLCESCHKVKTAKDREAPHGTLARYKRCKCDLCREANTLYRRDVRARNRERS